MACEARLPKAGPLAMANCSENLLEVKEWAEIAEQLELSESELPVVLEPELASEKSAEFEEQDFDLPPSTLAV